MKATMSPSKTYLWERDRETMTIFRKSVNRIIETPEDAGLRRASKSDRNVEHTKDHGASEFNSCAVQVHKSSASKGRLATSTLRKDVLGLFACRTITDAERLDVRHRRLCRINPSWRNPGSESPCFLSTCPRPSQFCYGNT
ncbi:hypothetical protein PV11_02622 [Exophiala sideris]|uniref:Uncharacterized protein n=1 Tax=Exophiala sideris TaxID=1016849 RepID=A0A0D1XG37_9EURO|nr:hypothetical protein PV11_02622 [Exophiala sideris]